STAPPPRASPCSWPRSWRTCAGRCCEPMSAAAGQKLEGVGEKVGEAASEAAEKGWEGVRAVLEYRLLHLGDVEVTVGGLIAAVLTLLVVLVISRLVRRGWNALPSQTGRVSARETPRIATSGALTIGVNEV